MATLLEGLTADLPPVASDLDLLLWHLGRMQLKQPSVSGYSRGQPHHGPNVRVCLRSCGVGGCSSGTCQWTWMADFGVTGLLRRGPLNSWYQVGSVRI